MRSASTQVQDTADYDRTHSGETHNGYTPGYAGADEHAGVGLRELFAALWRRRYAMLGCLIAALVAALAYLSLATPQYRAEAHLLIEPQTAGDSIVQSVANRSVADQEAVRSETYVLTSSPLAVAVVETLDLGLDPEFNPPRQEPGILDRLLAALGDSDAGESAAGGSKSTGHSNDNNIIKRFRDRLTVAPVEDSRVISLRFRSRSAETAQLVTNTIAREYLALRRDSKQQSTRLVSGWLDRQIDELRGKVESGETDIENLRSRSGLVKGGEGSLGSQELAEVNSQLIDAKAARAEVVARRDKVRQLLQTPDGVQSASEVLNSTLIGRLREQETALRSTIAELYPELGPKHPRMQRLRSEQAELGDKIDAEIRKIVAGLDNDADVAAARVESLENSLAAVRREVAEANGKAVELRAMQREVDANRALLTSLLDHQKSTRPQNEAGFLQADARIISPATLPTEAAYPDRLLVLGLSVVASILLGGLLVLLLEMLDNGFRSPEEIDAQTAASALGFIPRARLSRRGGELRHLQEKPTSAFAEAIRTLLWSINLEFGDSRCKVLLFTSAQSGEGKTTVASSLAVTQARAGRKVLLIDADLRRPAIHQRLGIERHPGLVDYLAGHRSIGQVQAVRQDQPGICVIGAGDPDIDVQNLIANGRMQQLLERLRSRFDLILVDSPPMMVGADARLLSRMVDVTVLVVHWGKTRRQSVRLALQRLQSAGASRIGALLSQVDARKYATYGYGDSGAYTGDLAKYYAGT